MSLSTIGKHSMKQRELSTYEIARQQFPFFQRDNQIFAENAGGSQVIIWLKPKTICCNIHACAFHNVLLHKQPHPPLSNASQQRALSSHDVVYLNAFPEEQVPACVGDAVREHLLFNNAQLGAGHAVSNRSTDAVTKAHNVVKVSLLSGNAPRDVLCIAQGPQKAARG